MREALQAGTVVAGYRVEALIGHGGTGVVHRARDGAGRRVALKVLAPELAHDERFRARFLRETTAIRGVSHPHVVRVLGSGEADGLLYLAMELIDGPDLRELLRER